MKTHLIIYNEADYLQAHLTAIVSRSQQGNPVLHEFKKWVSRIVRNLQLR